MINIGLLILSWLLFGLAFILYFGSGNHLAPLLVWLGSAVTAAWRTEGTGNPWAPWIVAVGLSVILISAWLKVRRAFAEGQKFVERSNAKLRTIAAPAGGMFGNAPLAVGEELSREDLAFQRWFLDKAFLPLESFEGFTQLDQFQFAAYRYQISFIQFALAMAQYTRTPAFHGYASEAQRRLIEKMTARPVWSYWAYENFWGNFRLDADPIKRDNIMLSGYMLLMMGLYESTTGDGRFNTEGCLQFNWNDKTTFPYDNIRIAGAVGRNFEASKFGMFPCEPSLLFPICNIIAVNGLKIYDRLHGYPTMESILDRYRHATEVEFVGPDARPVGLRVERLGIDLKIPFPMDGRVGAARVLGGSSQRVLGPGSFAPLVCGVLPDIVERELLLGNLSRISSAVTSGNIRMADLGRYDVGNYRNTGAGVHPWMMIAAKEYGDDAFFDAIAKSADENLDPVEENGVRHYRALSVLSMGQMFMGRFSRKDGFYDLVNRGNHENWNKGPILAEAPYPGVLVARAVSDGENLELVLRPGEAGGGTYVLELARLRPGARYLTSDGNSIIADAEGHACLNVTLRDRLECDIRLAGAAG
ncbi:hypothetical protein [Sphingobium sp.]|uniref:linalool dehydratase/isomerase domain-containing protein n=1 Tax=Sphingobium sp. TaxID=1912891 RepID=UPI0028BF38D8|nr:hypothetical protein [Sphingobium sp.]